MANPQVLLSGLPEGISLQTQSYLYQHIHRLLQEVIHGATRGHWQNVQNATTLFIASGRELIDNMVQNETYLNKPLGKHKHLFNVSSTCSLFKLEQPN